MKPLFPLTLLLLSGLLTACPSTQTAQPPTPSTNLSGAWEGTLTHAGENVAVPLTITFTQSTITLGGTARIGPAFYDIGGDVTGEVDGNSATFAFSYLAGEDGSGDEVTQTMGTYSFTGTLEGDTLSGDAVGTIEGSDLSIPGTFTLERQ